MLKKMNKNLLSKLVALIVVFIFQANIVFANSISHNHDSDDKLLKRALFDAKQKYKRKRRTENLLKESDEFSKLDTVQKAMIFAKTKYKRPHPPPPTILGLYADKDTRWQTRELIEKLAQSALFPTEEDKGSLELPPIGITSDCDPDSDTCQSYDSEKDELANIEESYRLLLYLKRMLPIGKEKDEWLEAQEEFFYTNNAPVLTIAKANFSDLGLDQLDNFGGDVANQVLAGLMRINSKFSSGVFKLEVDEVDKKIRAKVDILKLIKFPIEAQDKEKLIDLEKWLFNLPAQEATTGITNYASLFSMESALWGEMFQNSSRAAWLVSPSTKTMSLFQNTAIGEEAVALSELKFGSVTTNTAAAASNAARPPVAQAPASVGLVNQVNRLRASGMPLRDKMKLFIHASRDEGFLLRVASNPNSPFVEIAKAALAYKHAGHFVMAGALANIVIQCIFTVLGWAYLIVSMKDSVGLALKYHKIKMPTEYETQLYHSTMLKHIGNTTAAIMLLSGVGITPIGAPIVALMILVNASDYYFAKSDKPSWGERIVPTMAWLSDLNYRGGTRRDKYIEFLNRMRIELNNAMTAKFYNDFNLSYESFEIKIGEFEKALSDVEQKLSDKMTQWEDHRIQWEDTNNGCYNSPEENNTIKSQIVKEQWEDIDYDSYSLSEEEINKIKSELFEELGEDSGHERYNPPAEEINKVKSELLEELLMAYIKYRDYIQWSAETRLYELYHILRFLGEEPLYAYSDGYAKDDKARRKQAIETYLNCPHCNKKVLTEYDEKNPKLMSKFNKLLSELTNKANSKGFKTLLAKFQLERVKIKFEGEKLNELLEKKLEDKTRRTILRRLKIIAAYENLLVKLIGDKDEGLTGYLEPFAKCVDDGDCEGITIYAPMVHREAESLSELHKRLSQSHEELQGIDVLVENGAQLEQLMGIIAIQEGLSKQLSQGIGENVNVILNPDGQTLQLIAPTATQANTGNYITGGRKCGDAFCIPE